MHGPTDQSKHWLIQLEIDENYPQILLRKTKAGPSSSFRSTASLETNKWIYLGVSYDASTNEIKFFQNGILLGTKIDVPTTFNGGWTDLKYIHLSYGHTFEKGKTKVMILCLGRSHKHSNHILCAN